MTYFMLKNFALTTYFVLENFAQIWIFSKFAQLINMKDYLKEGIITFLPIYMLPFYLDK